MKNLSKCFIIISIICILPLSVFAETDASSTTTSDSTSFTTTPKDNTTTTDTVNTTNTEVDTTTQTQDTTTENTITPIPEATTSTGTTTKSTTTSSYMDYLPYVLIAGSVILLISIIGILISGKKKGPQEMVQVTPQPTSSPETITPPSEPVAETINNSIPTTTPQTEQPKPTLADIVNQTTTVNPMYTQQNDLQPTQQLGNDAQTQQFVPSPAQPDFSSAQNVQTQPQNQFNQYQVPQEQVSQQPFSSNIDVTQSSPAVQQNQTQEQNYGASNPSNINTFQNKNTLSFEQPIVDQSVANDFFAPENNVPTSEPQITPEEPAINIPNTPNEEVAPADFQNMIDNEISKISQQPANQPQPIQPKVDETPSSELPQVPPTM